MKLFTPYTSEDEIPTYYHDFLGYIWYPFCMVFYAFLSLSFLGQGARAFFACFIYLPYIGFMRHWLKHYKPIAFYLMLLKKTYELGVFLYQGIPMLRNIRYQGMWKIFLFHILCNALPRFLIIVYYWKRKVLFFGPKASPDAALAGQTKQEMPGEQSVLVDDAGELTDFHSEGQGVVTSGVGECEQ